MSDTMILQKLIEEIVAKCNASDESYKVSEKRNDYRGCAESRAIGYTLNNLLDFKDKLFKEGM